MDTTDPRTASISPPVAANPLLRMTGIVKSFGAQRVLDQVDFDLRAGEVHVLAGENGAGKSTLIKILSGVHRPDSGEISLRGRLRRFRRPREAAANGIATIHQELSLVPSLSVADNIFLGRERSTGGWMRYGRHYKEAARALERLGLDLQVGRPVDSLPFALRQMVEIAKALAMAADVIIMDEPTSALNEPEVERLFATIAELKARNCGVIYITHKLEEVYRIADRITVLRDGRHVATASAAEMPAPALIRYMVGRDLAETGGRAPSEHASPGPVRLAVENLSVRAPRRGVPPLVDSLSFEVGAGEIVGLAGLHGSGNSDVLLALFGAHGRRTAGTVCIDGKPAKLTAPRRAIRRRLALVTNDRQRTGLVLGMNVAANVSLASLPRVSILGWLSRARESRLAKTMADSVALRNVRWRQSVRTLSGGSQQKVVLAKWLSTSPSILLLDEPTRGVDVGAKREIYQLMAEWRREGHAIVLITSELPELLLVCDRILVMHRGRAVTMLHRGQATQERILHAAMGGD